jgi:endonuclease YncB( thermonuclease family)
MRDAVGVMRIAPLAVVLVGLSLAGPSVVAAPSRAPCPPIHRRRALPLRVVDGDTFRLHGERIRIVGIDAPEIGEPGAADATARLGVLLRSGHLLLVRRGRDVYCRTLADVYVDGVNVAAVMRREGLAHDDRAAVRFHRSGGGSPRPGGN